MTINEKLKLDKTNLDNTTINHKFTIKTRKPNVDPDLEDFELEEDEWDISYEISEVKFTHIAPISIDEIVFEPTVRDACKANTCGQYGKSHSCPPNIGKIDDCINIVKQYKKGWLFQYVGTCRDVFDWDGMMEAQDIFNDLIIKFRHTTKDTECLILGGGPCKLCKKCAFLDNKPCRFPDLMISSVEGHGIFVNKTLNKVGLEYNNGENTVSYVGVILRK